MPQTTQQELRARQTKSKPVKARKPKPYMPWFIMDFERDTGHLSLEQCEAYRRLLEAQWKRDAKPLPDDDVVLARLIRVDMETWKQLRPAMEEFYDLSKGHWSHPRVVELWLWIVAEMESRSRSGRAGAEGRWGNKDKQAPPDVDAGGHAAALPSQKQPNPNPNPNLNSETKVQNHDQIKGSALAGGTEEEDLLTRTCLLVGKENFAKHKGLYVTYLRACRAAYRDALADAESRKKEAARGLPEAQIHSTWAKYFVYTFKNIQKAYAKTQTEPRR